MNESEGKIIGIDLGTTNSVVAHVNEQGQAEVINSQEGGRTVPSVFAITEDGEKLVGKLAVDQETVNASNTIRSIKRHMGTADRFEIGSKVLSPEEISAEILIKLKKDAEAFFGEKVTAAVITVPAYFNNDQRQSTKTAGELAGLKVLRIINEPTAASVAYGLDKKTDETVLVFDLGGGTFDVTVLKILDGMDFLVQSTNGDPLLGGDDFDECIYQNILKKGLEIIKKEHDVEIEIDDTLKSRFRAAAEQAKKELSTVHTANVSIPYVGFSPLGKPIHFKSSITKQEFEDSIEHLITKIKKCVFNAMEDAKLTFSEINEVVFVGGSTRVPIIADVVKEWTGKVPNRTINPDEAVAIGAAIQASILSGQSDRELYLVDVNPLTLGIETTGGVMTKMIERNTPVPAEFTDTYTTAEDAQKIVDVKVFQGERPQTKDNKFLAKFGLEVDPAPRGIPQIEVTFEVDANGILSVSAKDKITGKETGITITGSSSLTSEEIQKMLDDAEAYKEEDAMFTLVSNLQAVMKDQFIQVETILRDSRQYLTPSLVYDLKDILESLELAQNSENLDLMRGLASSAEESLKEASKLLTAAADAAMNNT